MSFDVPTHWRASEIKRGASAAKAAQFWQLYGAAEAAPHKPGKGFFAAFQMTPPSASDKTCVSALTKL
jgi:hypothetical protein